MEHCAAEGGHNAQRSREGKERLARERKRDLEGKYGARIEELDLSEIDDSCSVMHYVKH